MMQLKFGSSPIFSSTAIILLTAVPLRAGLNDGLVASYSFNGNTSDSSGNGLNGTVEGAVLTTDRFNTASSAYYFNGNAVVSVADDPAFNFTAAQGLTLATWAYRTSPDNPQHIIGKREDAYYFQLALGSGAMPDNLVPLNTWTHLVMTVNSAATSYFVNGQLRAAYGGTPFFSDSSVPLLIGGSGGYARFIGKLDEVKVYNRILTDQEIRDVADASPANLLTLDPRKTFYRAPGDTALTSVPVSLADLHIAPGDRVRLEELGDWSHQLPGNDTHSDLNGLFSSSSTVLGNDTQNRVPGALASDGPAVVTGVPFNDPLVPTDIAEDFRIDEATTGGVVVTVPRDAQYLFLSVSDSYFDDNADPDGDFALRISVEPKFGDANHDGKVDIRDLAIMLPNWMSSADWSGGDFTGDGLVDRADLALLARNWQAGVGGASLDANLAALGISLGEVPEPGASAIVMLGVGVLARPRRWRRRLITSLPT